MINPTAPVRTIVSNPLSTRQDLLNLVHDLLAPLEQYQSSGGARIRIGYGGVTSDPVASEFEGFARPLWGLAPLLAGDPDLFPEFRKRWVDGLDAGTDPSREDEFWGTYNERDQRYVEMAAVGFSLAIAPKVFWDPLSDAAKDRLHAWLIGSNTQEFPPNNWRFFRVFVNLGLKTVGREYDQKVVDDEFDVMEGFVGPHGFPSDGNQPHAPYDYYATAFAIPFYSLIYAKLADDERSERFRQRARENLSHVVHLFAPDGAAIPYGRSMLYRFATSAFFSAVVYADLDSPFSLGVLKGLILRNIRWFTQDPKVFSPDGTLPIGYTYPNLFVSEDYNCPQSSYWALKSLLILALPPDHAFWTVPEEPYPADLLKVPYHETSPWYQVFSHAAGHTFLLSAGQERHPHRNVIAKYCKFAYSADFGFSVSTGLVGLGQYAPDSTISASVDPDEETWLVRRAMTGIDITNGVIRSTWKAMDGLEITSWTIPPETTSTPYHTRIHKVTSSLACTVVEAGFAIEALTGPAHSPRFIPRSSLTDAPHASVCQSNAGMSAIVDILHNGTGRMLSASGNSNLIHPRTVIPTIRYQISPGTTWLAVKVYAQPKRVDPVWTSGWETQKTTVEDLHVLYPFLQ